MEESGCEMFPQVRHVAAAHAPHRAPYTLTFSIQRSKHTDSFLSALLLPCSLPLDGFSPFLGVRLTHPSGLVFEITQKASLGDW